MRRSNNRSALASYVMCVFAALGSGEVSSATKTPPPSDVAGKAGNYNTYIGLSYSPAWHKIGSFAVGANDGSTAAIYPNLLDTSIPLSGSFNWNVQNPNIRFEDSTVWGVEGSVGFKRNRTRVELEIGYERFEKRETRLDEDAGGTETMYLLAKGPAANVISGNTEELGRALADTAAQDIVAFAQAVGREAKEIDKKVCKKKVAVLSLYSEWLKGGMWSCNDNVLHPKDRGDMPLSKRFGEYDQSYPMQEDRGSYQTNRGWPGTAPGKINTAQGMAGDLVSNLNSEEKETVARIFSRVTGAEVIELHAVTTTSVMFNTCYDLQREGLVPFACVGVGASFVSVTDGHLASKLAYRLKAGLSFDIAPRVTAFVSGFYHKVLGDGKYYDIPVQHLLDDQSPEGHSKNYALAEFKLAYTGAEVGMRFAF